MGEAEIENKVENDFHKCVLGKETNLNSVLPPEQEAILEEYKKLCKQLTTQCTMPPPCCPDPEVMEDYIKEDANYCNGEEKCKKSLKNGPGPEPYSGAARRRRLIE